MHGERATGGKRTKSSERATAGREPRNWSEPPSQRAPGIQSEPFFRREPLFRSEPSDQSAPARTTGRVHIPWNELVLVIGYTTSIMWRRRGPRSNGFTRKAGNAWDLKNFTTACSCCGSVLGWLLRPTATPSYSVVRGNSRTEFSGGVVLALGVATRKVHWQTGFYGPGGFELPSLYAVIAAALWFTGPGKYSVDHLIQRSSRARAIPPCPDIGVARVSRR
jgi:hypothetical protein